MDILWTFYGQVTELLETAAGAFVEEIFPQDLREDLETSSWRVRIHTRINPGSQVRSHMES